MATPTNFSKIQNFNLFGEAGDLPDVVHCETIETRSKLHDWEFSPHRHARLHQVLLLAKGGGRAVIEGQEYALTSGQIVNVPTGCVHGFRFWEGTLGWVVTIGAEMIDESLHQHEGLRPVLSVAIAAKSSSIINSLMENLFDEYNGRGFGRAHILRSLSTQLVGQVARQIFEHNQGDVTAVDVPLQRRFETLVEQEYLNHWSVAEYADALSISPTHLSRVLRRATGQSASRIIESRMVREARRQLTYTNLSISQIAYALGYIDPAYFSRFFSKSNGISPRDFRIEREWAART